MGTCPRILSLNKTFIQNQGNTSDFVEKISVDGDDDSESNDAFEEPFFGKEHFVSNYLVSYIHNNIKNSLKNYWYANFSPN